jgi:hypothetical protein
VDLKYRPGGLNIHQIFIGVHRKAGSAKWGVVPRSRVVRVFSGTEWGRCRG